MDHSGCPQPAAGLPIEPGGGFRQSDRDGASSIEDLRDYRDPALAHGQCEGVQLKAAKVQCQVYKNMANPVNHAQSFC